MRRTAEPFLTDWLKTPNRKPLVIRGARQVGKTWLTRNLAQTTNHQLIELNFERNPQLASLFSSNDPHETFSRLRASLNVSSEPATSILFLDEIQAVPELFAKLRWFAEEMPTLPVIAAGSLLEFLLNDHEFSMPVGRVSFMHLEPLSFEEFLWARGKNLMHQYLLDFRINTTIPSEIHQQLLALFKEYIVVGGMPASVASWCADSSTGKVSQIQHDLLATYRADFAKYRGNVALPRLEEVMWATPKLLGQKFVFSQVNQAVHTNNLRQAVTLLNQAGICHSVFSTAANGIPLASERKEKFFKEIFLDVGLCCAALGLGLSQIQSLDEITLVNKGALAEQVVGQLLRTIEPFYIEPALYYWRRDQAGSQAEIDYIIAHQNTVVPLEVKAGAHGTLKSLQLFMAEKGLRKAVKVSSALPSLTEQPFQLLSLPFYLLGQLPRLLSELPHSIVPAKI
jgi:predicted AAA+ superfamily ATPase